MKWYEGRRWYEWAGMGALLLILLADLVMLYLHLTGWR